MLPLTTPQQLLEALKDLHGFGETTEAPKAFRYVIYARKSTDEESKQVRSLGDQILACQEHAEKHNLDIRGIVQESESAKSPDTRPKFREMIRDITERGKYDAILSWHPDRLARNMKDAGEIIDLLDKHVIKDLEFASFAFENSATGKMTLGIMFVLSKEYTDKLSDDVSRGNRYAIEAGEYINKAKHGYYKDTSQHLHTDGDNFLLIKTAFRMRLEKKTLDEIAAFLNEHRYLKWRVKDGKRVPYTWDKQKVAKVMNNPAYAGVVMYGKKAKAFVNLIDAYGFTPAVAVPDFMAINKLDTKSQLFALARKYRKDQDVKANLLRGMVICAECGEAMYTGITKKPNKSYFYYRCDNGDCNRKPKSVRAKVVMNYVKEFLESKPFSSKEVYDHYADEMKRVSAQRIRNAQNDLLALRLEKGKLENRIIKTKELLLNEEDEEIKSSFRQDLKRHEARLPVMEGEIRKAEVRAKAHKAAVITYGDFLELMDKMPETLARIKNMGELDYCLRKIFSNFVLREKKVEKSTLCEPFEELYALKVSKGGGLATPLELYDFLATHAETIQAWNEAVKAFIAEERRPELFAVKL